MLDSHGRKIEYMRLSVTDRCNLRCRYCMPEGHRPLSHDDILRYEEFIRLCRIAVSLGIDRFKVTGGEPLVRRDCAEFISELKQLAGVREVTITTNGILLPQNLDKLLAAGIDGITVSLDSLSDDKFRSITGSPESAVGSIMGALEASATAGVRTKINTVLLRENRDEIVSLARIAENMPVDVRFIEIMPIGYGAGIERVSPAEALTLLKEEWPDLRPTSERRGNGPARHFMSDGLKGRIGIIDAVSNKFCASCNRVRLTATGSFKPCLCYDTGTDLNDPLRSGASDNEIRGIMCGMIEKKPVGHCFDEPGGISETHTMSQIGG